MDGNWVAHLSTLRSPSMQDIQSKSGAQETDKQWDRDERRYHGPFDLPSNHFGAWKVKSCFRRNTFKTGYVKKKKQLIFESLQVILYVLTEEEQLMKYIFCDQTFYDINGKDICDMSQKELGITYESQLYIDMQSAVRYTHPGEFTCGIINTIYEIAIPQLPPEKCPESQDGDQTKGSLFEISGPQLAESALKFNIHKSPKQTSLTGTHLYKLKEAKALESSQPFPRHPYIAREISESKIVTNVSRKIALSDADKMVAHSSAYKETVDVSSTLGSESSIKLSKNTTSSDQDKIAVRSSIKQANGKGLPKPGCESIGRLSRNGVSSDQGKIEQYQPSKQDKLSEEDAGTKSDIKPMDCDLTIDEMIDEIYNNISPRNTAFSNRPKRKFSTNPCEGGEIGKARGKLSDPDNLHVNSDDTTADHKEVMTSGSHDILSTHNNLGVTSVNSSLDVASYVKPYLREDSSPRPVADIPHKEHNIEPIHENEEQKGSKEAKEVGVFADSDDLPVDDVTNLGLQAPSTSGTADIHDGVGCSQQPCSLCPDLKVSELEERKSRQNGDIGTISQLSSECKDHSGTNSEVNPECNSHSGKNSKVSLECNDHSGTNSEVCLKCNNHSGMNSEGSPENNEESQTDLTDYDSDDQLDHVLKAGFGKRVLTGFKRRVTSAFKKIKSLSCLCTKNAMIKD